MGKTMDVTYLSKFHGTLVIYLHQIVKCPKEDIMTIIYKISTLMGLSIFLYLDVNHVPDPILQIMDSFHGFIWGPSPHVQRILLGYGFINKPMYTMEPLHGVQVYGYDLPAFSLRESKQCFKGSFQELIGVMDGLLWKNSMAIWCDELVQMYPNLSLILNGALRESSKDKLAIILDLFHSCPIEDLKDEDLMERYMNITIA
jgi:hypothetical protein